MRHTWDGPGIARTIDEVSTGKFRTWTNPVTIADNLVYSLIRALFHGYPVRDVLLSWMTWRMVDHANFQITRVRT